MKLTTMIDLISNSLEDSDRKEVAKAMIDTMDNPASLLHLKKYLDKAVEYEKAG